jgi:addiction module HigA family antidote
MKRAYLIHPGEILAQELEERWRSQKYFAELIWKTPQEVSHIITWKRNINADWAVRLSRALWTSESIWLNMQNRYDIFLLEHSEKNVIFDRIKERASLSNQQLAIA